MSGLRRAFLAVVLPPSGRAWAESAQNSAAAVAADLRWSRSEQRHLTVQFLGAVPDVAPVAEFVADSALRREPFTLSLGGGGAFPNARRASVLWLGVCHGSDQLTDLAVSLSSLSNEDRPFRAHLTLARAPKARDLRDVVAALDACGESEPWTVDEVVLFESDGSTHTEQARFRLAG
jgi:2'-5' RNA ligase